MEKVLDKFNEITENEFSFIKLSSVNVNVRKCTCEFNFIYPSDKETLIKDRRDYIENVFGKLIKSVAEVKINLKKSHFDFDFFKADFFQLHRKGIVFIQQMRHTQKHADCLRDHRRYGRRPDAPVKTHEKQHIQRHIQQG